MRLRTYREEGETRTYCLQLPNAAPIAAATDHTSDSSRFGVSQHSGPRLSNGDKFKNHF
jgi:hypothetical protein